MNTLIDEIIQIKNELIQSKEKFEKLIARLVDDESEDESDDEELQSRLHTIREGYKVPEAQYDSEDEVEDNMTRLRKILAEYKKDSLYDVDSDEDDD